MDFSLSDSQQEFQRAARSFFADHCPTTAVREIEAGKVGYDPALWREMADLGWLGLFLSEDYGGSGGSFLDQYPLCEEMGRCLLPSPYLDTVVVGGEVLLHSGNENLMRRYLPEIARGELILSPAIIESDGAFSASAVRTSATPQGDDFVISGTKLLVGFASEANYFLCACRTAGAGSDDGVTLFLVSADSPDIEWTPLENIAGAPLFEVKFNNTLVRREDMVGRENEGWNLLTSATTKAAVLQTVVIIGAARAVLEMTNRYAKEREQFGNPIGKYQAIQYMVSDILIAIHNAELLAKQAAYRIDAGAPYGREAALAIAYGKEAAAHVHRQAHEVHAGIGFILEHDLTLYSRRSKFWEYSYGDARHYQEQWAQAVNL